jgi:hypothetical protein
LPFSLSPSPSPRSVSVRSHGSGHSSPPRTPLDLPRGALPRRTPVPLRAVRRRGYRPHRGDLLRQGTLLTSALSSPPRLPVVDKCSSSKALACLCCGIPLIDPTASNLSVRFRCWDLGRANPAQIGMLDHGALAVLCPGCSFTRTSAFPCHSVSVIELRAHNSGSYFTL